MLSSCRRDAQKLRSPAEGPDTSRSAECSHAAIMESSSYGHGVCFFVPSVLESHGSGHNGKVLPELRFDTRRSFPDIRGEHPAFSRSMMTSMMSNFNRNPAVIKSASPTARGRFKCFFRS